MKKISMILFAAVLFVSFAACSGGSKKEAPVEEKKEEVQAPAQAPKTEVTPEQAVKAFTEYAKEYAEAYNNIAKEPAKFQKLASQMQQKVADMERLKVDFTAKQLKTYEKALELITEVNSGGKK